ncbi:glycosyltransferase family 4 protein, partial [Streptomyces sp. YIM 98790]|uniref:glycosyltransferase family 4 protein n=1 Tax=Streptomyces sp. YIM 98790 TaxID=2689077 RepID=UPI001A9F126C
AAAPAGGHGPREVPAPAARRPARPVVPGRVLHLVTNSPPYRNAGYTVRTLGIVRAQRAAGLDPHVVTRLGFPVAQGVWDGRRVQDLDGVPHHRLLPLLMPSGPAEVLSRNAELAARLVERLRPAVLHAATDHPNGRIALALRRTYGLPVVYEVRGFLEETWLTQAPGRTAADPAYRAARELETHCMRAADAVITLGEEMKREIASRGVPPDRIHVVPNAVDEEFLRPPPAPGPLRAALSLAPDEPVVGTVATLTPHEGIGTLLRAAAELRRRGTAVRVLVVGDGPQLPVLRRQAEALLPPGTVLFTGRVPHHAVRRHLALLDVFAVPRTADRVCRLVTPLKPVEAMACGIPVVASALPALSELVTDGVHGRLVRPDDPGAWAGALDRLLADPEARRRLGAAGRRRVARERTWSRVGVRTRDIYRMLGAA